METRKSAIEVLKEYYNQDSFLQRSAAKTRTHFVPANADRSGKAVSDYAPQVFEDEYDGNQDASKGIIGMLEVILEDFERTTRTTNDEEEKAVEEHREFV